MTVLLRRRCDDTTHPLAVDDWSAPANDAERRLLRRVHGPVLDLGCGPGRLVVALGELGIPALGIDASPHAVQQAKEAGAPALEYSVFDPLPGEGRWNTVLLFDGNVGIGGDPKLLLGRVAQLLAREGCAIVETGPPGAQSGSDEARLEREGEVSGWFPWAWVSADDLSTLADTAGLRTVDWQVTDGRWFARLTPQPPHTPRLERTWR